MNERKSSIFSLPSESAMREFLGKILPGRSPSVVHFRRNILDFCASPTARTVLLEGPIGSGKSTMARAIAALKRAAPLKPGMAADVLDTLPFVGPNLIDVNALPWYVELPLTGLTAELAEAQLFGAVKGAYTGAVDRLGVFEQAKRGRRRRGEAIPEGALMTGGIVFLDEIGDMLPAHQAKLLPVLSGGVFYRLGGEGHERESLVFEGTLIAATWKAVDAGLLRPDLLSRLATNRLQVPGLEDRMDDFEDILNTVERATRDRLKRAIEHIVRVEGLADRDYWMHRLADLRTLSAADRRQLGSVPWTRHGNLRGLSAVVDLVLERGMDAVDAVAVLPRIGNETDVADPVPWMIEELLQRTADGNGLAGHVSALELELRASLSGALKRDSALRTVLSTRLAIAPESLMAQIGQLQRSRRKVR